MSEAHKGQSPSNKGVPPSLETRRRLSLAHKGKPSSFKGRHHSLETKQLLSEISKEKRWTESHRRQHSALMKAMHADPNGPFKDAGAKISSSLKGKPTSGMKGKHHSVETKEKMSESLKGKPRRTGWHHSDATRKRISIALTGKSINPLLVRRGDAVSPETRRLISIAHKGKKVSLETRQKQSLAKKGKPSGMKGKHRSPETKKKISEGNKGKVRSLEWRKRMSIVQPIAQRNPEVRMRAEATRLKNGTDRESGDEREFVWLLAERLSNQPLLFLRKVLMYGLPDLYIPELKAAIFYDGCWPHRCIQCGWGEYGAEKRHVRDLDVTTKLQQSGYRVFRVWEHEFLPNKTKAIDTLAEELLDIQLSIAV
jgi:G:T-mismatch repair DNA endonuclease (very short patch repair protein)